MTFFKSFIILVLLALLSNASYASSVIPPRDFGILVQTSQLVILAKAENSRSFGRGNLIMTSTRFQVLDVIKGSVAIGQYVDMESYGGQTEDLGLAIGGSPKFSQGETYLLSLTEHNGAWMSRHMSYGLLVQRRMLTGERIFTHLEDSHDLNLVIPEGKTVELISNYKAEALIKHLKSVASGQSAWDKSKAEEVQEYDAHQSQSMLLPGNIMKLAAPPTGCEFMDYDGTKIRWKRFEDNQPVTVKLPTSATSQAVSGALTAVNAWKAVPDINIATLQSAGLSSITPTCGTDGLTLSGFLTGDARIFPDDPCNEVTDLSSCSGILAVAGPGFNTSGTHTANGETWITALVGFMIVNNGTPACLNATQYDQVITHELGHIIGFGHHTGAAANMNANCCNPITDLDRACAVYVYGDGTVTENPLPTITSINPNSIKAGTSNQAVVITGTGYQSTSQLFISPDLLGLGITIPSYNSTTINMQVTAPSDVTLGVRKFFVRNPTPGGGDSQQVDFFVTDTPTISSISPTTGNAGSTVNLSINGTKFATGLSSLVVDSDLTVSNFTVVNSTQITASLTIPSSTSSGSRSIRVSNLGTGGGNSNAQSFTIVGTATPPTLTSVSPNSGNQGEQVNVTLTGSNFLSGATISAGAGITVGSVSVVNSTSITAIFTIGSAATPGARNVTVSTSAGTSNAQVFTVNEPAPPAPTLTSVSPNSGNQGEQVNVTLTGSNFLSGATISAGAGITVGSVSVVNSTSITAIFTIGSAATPGARNVTVSTSAGTSNNVVFTVNTPSNPVPLITTLSPSSGIQGTGPNITISGSGFISTSQVSISGLGIQISNVSVVSATSITARLTIASNAATGVRQVTVSNPTPGGGTSNSVNFTVNELFVNKVPTLNPIPDRGFLHSAPEQVISLTGISAGSGESQNIAIQATAANPSLIPVLTVDYTSPQTTGTLRLRNDRTKVGSTTIRVRVKDDGGTANAGVDTLVRVFNVTVNLDTSVGDDEPGLPQEYELLQNYPNPFNPSTIIPFTLPNRARVTLSIFDVNGRERALLLDQEMSAGRHDISFDASNLSSGLYLIRLSSDLGIHTRMMMLVK